MDRPNVDLDIGRDLRCEKRFDGGTCPIGLRTLSHTSDREVRHEAPGFPRETYCLHGLLDALPKIVEPVEVAIQSDPKHARGAAGWEDAWPAQGEAERLLVADGLPESRSDGVDLRARSIAQKLQRQMDRLGPHEPDAERSRRFDLLKDGPEG